jgi:enamine deaminase RidA (YjgF/YER057c/UK114 family)
VQQEIVDLGHEPSKGMPPCLPLQLALVVLATLSCVDGLLLCPAEQSVEVMVSVRVFLTHFQEDYAAMNAVYASHFPPDRRPARTCIGVTGLARDARIEIDCIARRP